MPQRQDETNSTRLVLINDNPAGGYGKSRPCNSHMQFQGLDGIEGSRSQQKTKKGTLGDFLVVYMLAF